MRSRWARGLNTKLLYSEKTHFFPEKPQLNPVLSGFFVKKPGFFANSDIYSIVVGKKYLRELGLGDIQNFTYRYIASLISRYYNISILVKNYFTDI